MFCSYAHVADSCARFRGAPPNGSVKLPPHSRVRRSFRAENRFAEIFALVQDDSRAAALLSFFDRLALDREHLLEPDCVVERLLLRPQTAPPEECFGVAVCDRLIASLERFMEN